MRQIARRKEKQFNLIGNRFKIEILHMRQKKYKDSAIANVWRWKHETWNVIVVFFSEENQSRKPGAIQDNNKYAGSPPSTCCTSLFDQSAR